MLSLQSAILAEPLAGILQILRIRGSYEHLTQQRIRVERDGRDQAVQLFGGERLRLVAPLLLLLLGRGVRVILRQGRNTREQTSYDG